MEAAGLVFDLLQNVASIVSDSNNDNEDDTKWTPSTTSLPPGIKPTQVASTSDGASNVTANYILSQNNETYTFFSDPRLMSLNVVSEMSNSSFSRLKTEQDLFTSAEYRMFLDDPICFYANIESMYLDAFSSSSSSSTEEDATTTPTQSLQDRQLHVDESDDSDDVTMCSNVYGPNVPCSSKSDTPESTSAKSASIASLWATELPDQLWSAHFATPASSSDDVTATATSTTSCSGLNGGEGPVTQYRELKTRETSSGSDSTATLAANQVESGAARTRFACGLVGVVVAVGFSVL